MSNTNISKNYQVPRNFKIWPKKLVTNKKERKRNVLYGPKEGQEKTYKQVLYSCLMFKKMQLSWDSRKRFSLSGSIAQQTSEDQQ